MHYLQLYVLKMYIFIALVLDEHKQLFGIKNTHIDQIVNLHFKIEYKSASYFLRKSINVWDI